MQTFAERLFSRLQEANERLETRVAMMAVISRAVGVHQLLLLNFYPFLQKYIQPHQRDVTRILAILIQVPLGRSWLGSCLFNDAVVPVVPGASVCS